MIGSVAPTARLPWYSTYQQLKNP